MDKTDLILEVQRLQDEMNILTVDLELSKSENKVLKEDKAAIHEQWGDLRQQIKNLKEANNQLHNLVGQLLSTIKDKSVTITKIKRYSLVVAIFFTLVIVYLSCK